MTSLVPGDAALRLAVLPPNLYVDAPKVGRPEIARRNTGELCRVWRVRSASLAGRSTAAVAIPARLGASAGIPFQLETGCLGGLRTARTTAGCQTDGQPCSCRRTAGARRGPGSKSNYLHQVQPRRRCANARVR